jgi:hypothetical protein
MIRVIYIVKEGGMDGVYITHQTDEGGIRYEVGKPEGKST